MMDKWKTDIVAGRRGDGVVEEWQNDGTME